MFTLPHQFAVHLIFTVVLCTSVMAVDVKTNQPTKTPETIHANTIAPVAVPANAPADTPSTTPAPIATAKAAPPKAAESPSDPSTATMLRSAAPQENLPLGRKPTNANGQSASSATPPNDQYPWILQTLAALAVVIGLIFILRALMLRLGGRAGIAPAGRVVEVLSRTPIAPKTHILMLRIHQRIIVAAQSPGGINTLTTIDDQDEVAWVLSRIASSKPLSISRSFSQLMQRFEKDYDNQPTSTELGGDQDEQFVDRTRNEVSGLLSTIRSIKRRQP